MTAYQAPYYRRLQPAATNSWIHAAQARIHHGKAEGIHLDACGETRDAASAIGIVFTLTPEGRLTARQP
ncbi:hypothetical protein [Streptomyces sp. ADI91-18]|uniref:hypothetical protein n=1 Tax=Streptomyces sp. ADI91-18 TaxID=1522755 RepID=UPI000F54DFF3|nr:hypothetical protein [Streptomyces sp. ADI91-18]RPK29320.1 hypothetical protein EES37_34750 [Streptomyces sp. ADI91-18]